MNTRIVIYLLAVLTAFSGIEALAEAVVSVSAQKYAARPDDAFPVDYIVSWEGAPDAYIVLPPVLPTLDWGTATLLEIQASGTNEIRVTVGYRTTEPGTYTAPAFEIRLLESGDTAETTIAKLDETTPTQIVKATEVKIVFRGSHSGVWVGAVAVLLILTGGVVWHRIRKRRLAPSTESASSPVEQAQRLLHEARRNRLDGDFYAFYRALTSALTCIETKAPESHSALLDKLKRAIDDTGYRGLRPSDDVMEGDFKDVERLVAQEMQRIAKEN